jgi:hypothetical protein
MRTKVGLVPYSNHETKKNKNKNMTRAKQISNNNLLQKRNKTSYDKKTYPKLMLNILKVIENSILIYTYSTPRSKKFLKKLLTYMWPKFTHV